MRKCYADGVAEGEGFEPRNRFRFSGFQDRRIRPLCHPSSRLINKIYQGMTRLNNHRPKPLGLILFFVFKIRSDNFPQSNLPAQFFTLHCLQSFYLRIPFAFIQKRLVRNSKLLIP